MASWINPQSSVRDSRLEAQKIKGLVWRLSISDLLSLSLTSFAISIRAEADRMAMFIVRRVNLRHWPQTKENDPKSSSSQEERINEVSLNKKLLRSLATHDHTIISCTMVIASGGSHLLSAKDSKLYLTTIQNESAILRDTRCWAMVGLLMLLLISSGRCSRIRSDLFNLLLRYGKTTTTPQWVWKITLIW